MANRAALAVILLSTLAVGAACSSGDAHPELDPYLCTQQDIGDGFQQLTDGDFSVRNLADLAPDAGERERAFRAAGMERGRFVLFKQALPRPPFDPPLTVVCQVIAFDSPANARAWVESLQPDSSLADTAMGWIPTGGREVTQSTPLTVGTVGFPTRLFTVHAGSGREEVSALYSVSYHEQMVSTLVVGRASAEITIDQVRTLGRIVELRTMRLFAELAGTTSPRP